MLRRAAVLAAGLAMTACLGLAGVGATSATTPRAISNGSKWTIEANGESCEIETFETTNHTFQGDRPSDHGKWSVPAPTKVRMKWTGGEGLSGLTFHGTFDSSLQEYKGHLCSRRGRR
jgi:hypothetical protein